jgi:hypothetical protein
MEDREKAMARLHELAAEMATLAVIVAGLAELAARGVPPRKEDPTPPAPEQLPAGTLALLL